MSGLGALGEIANFVFGFRGLGFRGFLNVLGFCG